MSGRRLFLLLVSLAALVAVLPMSSAAAAVTINGSVTSASGEVNGYVALYELTQDETGASYDTAASAEIVDGVFSLTVEPGAYAAGASITTVAADGLVTEVYFEEPEVTVTAGVPLTLEAPVRALDLDLSNAEGQAVSAEVGLSCAYDTHGEYGFRQAWFEDPVQVDGQRRIWVLRGAECEVTATDGDGVAHRLDLETNDDVVPLARSMVLVSHRVSGALDIPIQDASWAQVDVYDENQSYLSSKGVPVTSSSYELRTSPGRRTLVFRAEHLGGTLDFTTSRTVEVQGDTTLDVQVPSAPVQVDVVGATDAEHPVSLSCGVGYTNLRSEQAYTAQEDVPVDLVGLPTDAPTSCNLTVYGEGRSGELVSAPVVVDATGINRITAYLESGAVIHGDPAQAVDDDGVDAQVEALGPNSGDGNNDGQFDYLQDNVTTLPMNDAEPDPDDASKFVTLAGPDGSSLQDVSTLPVGALPNPPAGITLPAGLVSFTLTGIPSGSEQDVSLHTPYSQPTTGYAKYHGDQWVTLPSDRVESSWGVTTITLTDGGIGDADGDANGVIVDPGGIAQIDPSFDVTPPTVTGTATSPPNEYGWYRGDVTIDWQAIDAVSTVADPPDTVVDGEGTGLSAESQQVCDTAGNCATGTVTGIDIDRTGPEVTLGEPGPHLLGSVPTLHCTAQDLLSGVDGGCTVGPASGGNANGTGLFEVTMSARDKAGNATTSADTYSVHYRFDGFLSPINDPLLMPAAPMSVFKRNSTVPVAFQLKNAAGQIVTPDSPPRWLAPERGASMAGGVNETVTTVPETDGDEFTWRGDRWQYNWKTKGYPAGYTYDLGVRLDDGTTHHVTIALR